MINKEIIIDGVNVKDCKRRIGKNSYCRYFKRPCADNNFNCIWKQLKRLEKENEELKEKLKITETAFEMVQNTIGQAHIEGVNLARKNHKLKIAFEEVREIMEKTCVYTTVYQDCVKCKSNLAKIINKIDEVINGNK